MAREPQFAQIHETMKYGILGERLAAHFGTEGSPISLNTACASGGSAIQLGVEAMRRGECQVALAVGADGSLTPESLVRFSLLSALSTQNDPPGQASKPFSKNRDGFVLAEGAAALVLEDLDHAQARGARMLGILEGCGEKSDSFHRTRSSPDGKPIIACMRNALADAGIGPEDVDYINAHGTSTPENDKMEYLGVSTVFGEHIRNIPISSNKSMIGHTLTAAGAVEAAFTPADARAPAHSADHQLQHARSGDRARRRAEQGARRKSAARHLQLVRLRRPERLPGHDPGAGVTGVADTIVSDRAAPAPGKTMRALTLVSDRKIELLDVAAPPAPAAGEVQIAHQGDRPQSHRRLGLARHGVCQAQAAADRRRRSGGRDRRGRLPMSPRVKVGDRVVAYGALTCGTLQGLPRGPR